MFLKQCYKTNDNCLVYVSLEFCLLHFAANRLEIYELIFVKVAVNTSGLVYNREVAV